MKRLVLFFCFTASLAFAQTAPTVTPSSAYINFGQNVSLSASGCSGTVMWSDGQSGANITVSPKQSVKISATCIGDTHLKIKSDEDYEKLFFMVDAPISSMDFSHVYTLCGVIRDINQIIDKLKRERIIIFTHNNDFMRVLTSNNIIDKKLLLKKGELKDFNNNLTVPYINHLMDIYSIARKGEIVNHTTANLIRHIIETLTKFQNIEVSIESIANYIKVNIPNDTKSYTLINDLSHGGANNYQLTTTIILKYVKPS